MQRAAAAINLELIQVPRGATATLEPLDASFNGPMLKVRRRLWQEMREKNPFSDDSQQAAIERALISYERMTEAITVGAFEKLHVIYQ